MDEKIGTILYLSGNPVDDLGAEEFDLQNLYSWCTWDIVNSNKRRCYFEYTDEDGVTVKGESEQEWNAVLDTAKKVKDFTVSFHDLSLSNKKEKCSKLTSCCPPVQSTHQIPKIAPANCSGKLGCCPMFDRPEPHVDDGKPYVKRVNPYLDKYKYTGDALMAVAFPLGALGGGSIAVAGDGGLRQWQISNKVNHIGHVPNSFFGVKVNGTALALQSPTLYNQSQFKPAPYISDHIVPTASKFLLSKITGVETIEMVGKFPVVEVDYIDKTIETVGVHLEAWSPKIPHQSQESAIPVIFFDFTLTNKGKTPVEVSLLGSLQNIAGWDGITQIANEVNFHGYGGNANSLISTDKLYGIKMNNPTMKENDDFNGTVSIFCQPEVGDKTSSLLQYGQIETLWNAFKANSHLPGQGIAGVSPIGSTFNGAVNTTRTLNPGANTIFKYGIAWHFPNRIKDWSHYDTIPRTPVNIGTHYANVWKNIDAVLDDAVTNYVDRRTLTYKFRDAMFNSTLPWQLIDSAAGRISVLNSPSCMWHADGNFYCFEGCSEQSGCCPLNCTHVLNYEMALAYLYPDLERNMRNIDLLHNINPYGVIVSRTQCPMEIKRVWSNWENYSTNPASTEICVDGEIGTVLKVYREVLNGASKDWLNSVWPAVKLTMNRWLNEMDTKKEGMVFGPQPNTYDRTIYGYNIFIGLLYLCALKATVKMALLQNDADFATECSNRFEIGSKNLDEKCFNGNWYVQVVDPNHQTQLMTDATIIGAMYGQWWSHVLGLGYLLPQDHIKSHLLNTYLRNYVESFDPATQSPRHFADKFDSGWLTAVWNQLPKDPLLHLQEIAWSGVIYPFAAMLLFEGFEEEGKNMLALTRQFYDGTRRNPWNEIECGDHYTRPMSSFALFTLSSGQKCIEEGSAYNVSFNPILCQNQFIGFFIFPTCWGTYTQQTCEKTKQGFAKLKLSHGQLSLVKFTMKDHGQTMKNISVGPNIIEFQMSKDDGFMHLSLEKAAILKMDDELTITF